MDHSVEIKLLRDPEFIPTVLMNALFGKLHRALNELDSRDIGISFPDVEQAQSGLGERLRLHGSHDNLQSLLDLDWLIGMRDHSSVGDLVPIPTTSQYRVVRRVQSKSSPERLRRRLAKRKGLSVEETRHLITDYDAKYLNLPFVSVRSQSTGQMFRLFIDHKPLQARETLGEFSHYGLSANSTVPWF
jgi:CRISPR-associated endonuclease Csy4